VERATAAPLPGVFLWRRWGGLWLAVNLRAEAIKSEALRRGLQAQPCESRRAL